MDIFSEPAFNSFDSAAQLDVVPFHRKTPPPISDIEAIVKGKIRKFKNDSFTYLTYTVPRTSEFWTPYSLVEVPYQHADDKRLYTISRHGVTYFSVDECHFTELDVWEREYEQYQKLLKVGNPYRIS